LSGANTRRIRGALAPLLREGPLSKDAVSRLVGRLAEEFRTWGERDLAGEDDLRLAGEESAASWREVVASLVRRNVGAPVLAIIDGNPGLHAALKAHWPGISIQRCTNHKLWNLEAKAPARLREELREDYRRMIYAEDATAVEKARTAFHGKWKLRCPPVAASFEKAGDELFTFLRFPSSQWEGAAHYQRARADQRRAPPSHQDPGQPAEQRRGRAPALRASPQRRVKLRTIDGWKDMPQVAKRVA
jgi:transposase-like protein